MNSEDLIKLISIMFVSQQNGNKILLANNVYQQYPCKHSSNFLKKSTQNGFCSYKAQS